MQQYQLGQYRGGRENLMPLAELKAPPVVGFAEQMAHDASGSVYARLQERQRAADTLSSQLALREYDNARQDQMIQQQLGLRNQYADEANRTAESALAGENAGNESAMLDWANNVLGSYQPDSPEYKQADKTIKMIQGRSTRGNAKSDKAYLAYLMEHDIANPFSQGSLGAAGWQQSANVKKPSQAAKKPIYSNGNYGKLDQGYHD